MGKTYNRIAREVHPVGHIFRGYGVLPLAAYAEVEDALARNRPAASPPRSDCVYMKEDLDFSSVGVDYEEGYVHTVEPQGDVERRDIYWIGVLVKRYAKSAQMRKDIEPHLSDDEVAQRYWGGTASPSPTWEFIATEATVVGVNSTLVPVRPGSVLERALNATLDKKGLPSRV
ncbi:MULTISPECIES: hypothetical protein [unclassified Sinorhizobium]|uniref:hypothetical protein n=1 Tax=unclassified Sinorhizobium TaxID=2613772 RepID=UPI0024C23BF6|nr:MULTISPECIES: hypothetical protein [unclassified Sinorhizobium]MDK1378189.1 hypothetical protein [Sinorhizobium sp. 6-70]MDK1479762.1 hypothetical protein [Sinorhizobium sp. 6-117]